MSEGLRRATIDDVPAILALRDRLRLRPGGEDRRGGFLLGCDAERYAAFIAHAEVTVMDRGPGLSGFAIALPDPVLRASEVWQRRGAIRWFDGAGEPPPGERIAYFEQLALDPDAPRCHGPALALAAATDLLATGHVHLFATLLQAPVRNAASLPLLEAVGARAVGLVEEEYAGIGAVVSALHHLHLPETAATLARAPLWRRLSATVARLRRSDTDRAA